MCGNNHIFCEWQIGRSNYRVYVIITCVKKNTHCFWISIQLSIFTTHKRNIGTGHIRGCRQCL